MDPEAPAVLEGQAAGERRETHGAPEQRDGQRSGRPDLLGRARAGEQTRGSGDLSGDEEDREERCDGIHTTLHAARPVKHDIRAEGSLRWRRALVERSEEDHAMATIRRQARIDRSPDDVTTLVDPAIAGSVAGLQATL